MGATFREFVNSSFNDRQANRAMKDSWGALTVTKDELEACKIPTICFIGSEDGLKPYADALGAVLPGVEKVELEGAGHLEMATRKLFKSRLREFLLEHAHARTTKTSRSTTASSSS